MKWESYAIIILKFKKALSPDICWPNGPFLIIRNISYGFKSWPKKRPLVLTFFIPFGMDYCFPLW